MFLGYPLKIKLMYMFEIKVENHPPQILPSIEHHCSCILFPPQVQIICLIPGASQGYPSPTGHSEVLPFPEYLKSKASDPQAQPLGSAK